MGLRHILTARVIAAFILTPLVTIPLSFILSPSPRSESSVLFPVVLAYLGTFVLGFPTFLLLRHRRWLAFWQVFAAGAILGLAFPVAFSILTGTNWFAIEGYQAHIVQRWFGASVLNGCAIACAFFIVAIMRKQGSDEKPTPAA